MEIDITIKNEDGDIIYLTSAPTVDMAIEKLGQFERNYEKDV